MSDYQDLLKWVDNSLFKGHLEVVKATRPVYHVSHAKSIPRFVPSIGRRQAADEDRTIPRVCCAPTLLGCFKGHMAIEKQFHQKHGSTKEDVPFDIVYQGGWKVFELHPDAYLIPDTLLLHDGDKSGEVWLTTYNKNTGYYPAVIAATCFYETITYRAVSGSHPRPYGVLFVDVHADKFQFSANHVLSKGHYCITGPTQQSVRDYKDDSLFRIEAISEADYLKAKHGSADMLGYQESPVFLDWK